jgi:hypothetical protein
MESKTPALTNQFEGEVVMESYIATPHCENIL